MSYAPKFNPLIQFSDSATVDPEQLDVMFQQVKDTLDALLYNQAAITRSDAKLANNSVHASALSSEALALISTTWSHQGSWAGSTDYAQYQSFLYSKDLYLVVVAHTSSNILADVASGYIVKVSTTQPAPTVSLIDKHLCSGSSSSYAITTSYNSFYVDGESYIVEPNHINEYSPTLNRDDNGVKAIYVNNLPISPNFLRTNSPILVSYSLANDRFDVINGKESLSESPAFQNLKLTTAASSFSLTADTVSFRNQAGQGFTLESVSLSGLLPSATIDAAYSYINDIWYDVYILASEDGSVAPIVRLTPNTYPASATTPNATYPLVRKIGMIRNVGGALRPSKQIGYKNYYSNISEYEGAPGAGQDVDLDIPFAAVSVTANFKGLYVDTDGYGVCATTDGIGFNVADVSTSGAFSHLSLNIPLSSGVNSNRVTVSCEGTNTLRLETTGFTWS